MATIRYSVPPAGTLEQVVVATGAAVVTAPVEITIDIGTGVVNDFGATRKISRSEALQAIDAIKESIVRSNWPPL